MIKFERRGPIFEKDGTKIFFKRVSQAEINEFNIKHNPFRDRAPDDKKIVMQMIREGRMDEVEYTDSEVSLSLQQIPLFCVEFVDKITGLEDGRGDPLEYDTLPDQHKVIFFEDLYNEDDDFRDFVLAVKVGAKKKSD